MDIPAWIGRHGTDSVDPKVELVIKHLREDLGIKKIAGAGYCFGGKVRLHSFTNIRIDDKMPLPLLMC